MKVLKFGGTSVGTLQAVRNLKRIVEAERTPVIVVVSALKTVTNNLVKATGLASRGNGQYRDVLEEVVDAHHALIDDLIADAGAAKSLKQQLGGLFDELGSILRGVFLIKDVTPKTEDASLSYGERCSSRIMLSYSCGS